MADFVGGVSCLETALLRRLQARRVGPIDELRRRVGEPSSPEQVVLLLTRRKPRGFRFDLSREGCNAISKRLSLLEKMGHDAAPFL